MTVVDQVEAAAAPDEPGSTGLAALKALRRTRQLHRLGNLDWFEAMYRAYLFGIFGGGGVLWISSSIKDEPLSAATQADVLKYGPAVLGVFVAFAFLAGIRGGAQGGPVALEAADVAHVMLAPVNRRSALMRPASQRLRSALFMGVALGAIVGQLAGRRLPGSLLAWAAAGALYGASLMAVWVGAALLAHTLRVPRWLATLLGLGVLGWQIAAVVRHVPGPCTAFGSLALWGWRQQTVDLVAVAVAVAMVVVGFVLLARLSLDALARRSALVAQLRFAVTMQDLRTVILLRRQLNQEHARRRPYIKVGGGRGVGFTGTVWRRGWHGLLRFPVSRLIRMATIAAGMGVLQAAVVRGTTPAFLGTAILGFVLGLEVMEPLSQEVDQADRADALPLERGELMARHLAAPIVALVPFAAIAGVAAVITLGGNSDAIVPVAILAIPTVVGAAMGGVVSIVRDAPDPTSSNTQQAFMPPEMVGFTTFIRLAWPVVVSTVTTVTVLVPRAAWRAGESASSSAVRVAVGLVLIIAFTVYWVKVRDRMRQRIRSFMDEGRSYTAQQRSSA